MTSAKALGGGVMPIGALIARPAVWQKFIEEPFFHTTTTGGNPLACAAAIATINVILEEDLPRQAAEKGAYFMERLQPLVDRYPTIYERITGKGLLLCQHFHDSDVGYKVSAGLFHRGVLLGGTLTNAKTIRIEPPLVIEYDEIDEMLNRLEDTLQAVTGAPVTGDVSDSCRDICGQASRRQARDPSGGGASTRERSSPGDREGVGAGVGSAL